MMHVHVHVHGCVYGDMVCMEMCMEVHGCVQVHGGGMHAIYIVLMHSFNTLKSEFLHASQIRILEP